MMGHKGYYTSEELARKTNVTVRAAQYYDKWRISKSSQAGEAGHRLYTDEDFRRLQRILPLKYLGFSLGEVMAMMVNDEVENIAHSLDLQKELIGKRTRHLQTMAQTLDNTTKMLGESRHMDQNNILNLIHITNMEHASMDQYKIAVDLDVRIELHRRFSHDLISWFPWLLSQIEPEMADSILEVGCGNGELQQEAELDNLRGKSIPLTDVSVGMMEDASELLKSANVRQEVFRYAMVDCQRLPYGNTSFDRVIANHVLFYVKNLDKALEGISRVTRKDGVFCCSAYDRGHMKEITSPAQEFGPRVMLSKMALYELLGLENSQETLEEHFDSVEEVLCDNYLIADEAGPLLDYILSYHGNRSEILSQHQLDFKSSSQKKMREHGCVHVTKMTGIFICRRCAQSQ